MKVLKNNYDKKYNNKEYSYPKKIICEECGSELEYEYDDVVIGELGASYVKCPLCGNSNMADDGIDLNIDNICFPNHFFHFCKEEGAVDVCNNEKVKEFIKECIEEFRYEKDEDFYVASKATGNLLVIVFRYDGEQEYHVIVTNNYYDTYLKFEPNDYF